MIAVFSVLTVSDLTLLIGQQDECVVKWFMDFWAIRYFLDPKIPYYDHGMTLVLW